jgi:Xaa-Pro aminopeptidase
MSKHDFPLEEYMQRRARVRESMAKQGIDLLLVTDPVSVNYLIAARGKIWQFFRCLFLTLEDEPLTFLVRRTEVAEVAELSLADDIRPWGGGTLEDPIARLGDIMREKGWLNRRIGIELPDYYISVHEYDRLNGTLRDSRVTEATHIVRRVRRVKSQNELAYMRKATEALDAGVDTFHTELAAGKTEHQVCGRAIGTMLAMGCDETASPMNFSSGPRTAYAHGLPSDRVMQNGDLIHTEYGASYRRYNATIGRVFSLGKPTKRMREIYDVVRDACDACIATMKDGVPAIDAHEAARKVIVKAGMEDYRLHTSGYILGPAFPPLWVGDVNMIGGSEDILQENMILSIEPPVFIAEEGLGARIIDNVRVTKTGAEIMSRTTRDLVVV